MSDLDRARREAISEMIFDIIAALAKAAERHGQDPIFGRMIWVAFVSVAAEIGLLG
jgi:hypothetical protein